MTLISSIVVFTSFLGILSFGCWELDMEQIPVLYNFGTFLAFYWFHDRLKPGKAHYGNFSPDGPPLVAVTGSGAARPWPYNSNTGINYGGIVFNENDENGESADRGKLKEYTPVNGLYGVTNVKEGSRDRRLEYYPAAIEPNDYIARILLGEHADWTQLVNMGPGGDPHLHNEKWFKYGSPFGAAEMGGPGDSNNEEWSKKTRYMSANPNRKLMVPLTSTGSGFIRDPYFVEQYPQAIRDYSGGEYNGSDATYSTSLEREFVRDGSADLRPDWYAQDQKGNIITNQRDIAAWPGEGGINDPWTSQIDPTKVGKTTYPTFYDPSVSSDSVVSWGATSLNSNSPENRSQWYNGNDPTTQQLDYIVTQLNTGTTKIYEPVGDISAPKSSSKKKSYLSFSR